MYRLNDVSRSLGTPALTKKQLTAPLITEPTDFQILLRNSRTWSAKVCKQQPNYLKDLQIFKRPKFLWIGCCDNRVPIQQLLNLQPGDVFVHRNLGNMVPLSDNNIQAVIDYAVRILEVQNIIVSGHNECSAIKAVLSNQDFGNMESWLTHLREIRSLYKAQLIGTKEQQEKFLTALNVKKQVLNVGRIASVQRAWFKGKILRVHGLVFQPTNGSLQDVGITLSSLEHIPMDYRIPEHFLDGKESDSHK